MHHLEDESALGEEYVPYEPELEVKFTAQDIDIEGSMKFRTGNRLSWNPVNFLRLNTKKFR